MKCGTPLTAAIQPKFWAQDLKITLKPPKKIADLIPNVLGSPTGPILPPLHKFFAQKPDSNPGPLDPKPINLPLSYGVKLI